VDQRSAPPLATEAGVIGWLDEPAEGVRVDAVMTVTGWALIPGTTVARVDAFVDGRPLGSLERSRVRLDVAERLGADAHAACGFGGRLYVGDAGSGEHALRLRLWAADGRRHELERRVVAADAIAAHLDVPEHAVARETLDVHGWAYAGPLPLEIEVLLDGRPQGPLLYGVPRPDVAATHGGSIPESCGYLVRLDLGAAAAGAHTLLVRIRDGGGRVREDARRLEVVPALRAFLDLPADGAEVTWLLNVAGWVALPAEAIERVEVLAGTELAGVAPHGVSRADAATRLGVPAACGFGGRIPLRLPAGARSVAARVRTRGGHQLELRRAIVVRPPLSSAGDAGASVRVEQVAAHAGNGQPRNHEADGAARAAALAQRVLPGFCNVAGVPTELHLVGKRFREDLFAAASGSTSRQRQMVCALALAVVGSADATLPAVAREINRRRLRLFTAEAASVVSEGLAAHVEPGLLVCSEYLDEGLRSGERRDGVLHQDLQRTSFGDAEFDIVLTSDVMEHVPDAPAAEREIVRILRPGGCYCFTVPLEPGASRDRVRALREPTGAVRNLAPPEYHDDPLRPRQRALVYRSFALPELRARFEALGCELEALRLWSRELGILGDESIVFTARRRPPRIPGAGIEGGLGLCT
jgi:SAM-dependent methyltransferase